MRALVIGAALLAAGSALPAQTLVRHAAQGTDWSALADSLHDVGRYREAIAAYERAMQAGTAEPARAAFNIARGYAHLENRRQALRWLEHAVSLGLAEPEVVRAEREFDRYRDDAQFRAIVEQVGQLPGSRRA